MNLKNICMLFLHLIRRSSHEAHPPPSCLTSFHFPCSTFCFLNPIKSWIWVSPPGVLWPHPWALWECLPAGWSPSSCGCGCVLSGWGSQRCPGPELCWGTSFTKWRGASGQQAEGVGEPSRGPCLWLRRASALLIRTGAPATQGDLNILKAPGTPNYLASPAHLAQGHTLTSILSGRCSQKWRHKKSPTLKIHGQKRGSRKTLSWRFLT